MANLKQEALKALFNSLPSKSSLYHYSKYPGILRREGFRKSVARSAVGDLSSDIGEPTGLYFARKEEDLGPLIDPEYGGDFTANVIAKPLPTARQRSFSPDEWKPYERLPSTKLHKILSKKYDFIEYPDVDWNKEIKQTVQLNPKKSVAMFTGEIPAGYRILGLAGALGLGGSQLMPDEANAFPIGKAYTVGKKTLGSLSKASDRLMGKEVNGKIVKEIRHGHGDWREILYEDGTALPVTKDYINALCRRVGTENYLDNFAVELPAEKLNQARKSAGRHAEMAKPVFSKSAHRDLTQTFHDNYVKRTEELGKVAPESVMVRNKEGVEFMLPTPYAKLLQKKGDLVILNKKGVK